MEPARWIFWTVLAAIAARGLADVFLERLNAAHARQRQSAFREAGEGQDDAQTRARAIDYTLAKSRLNQIEAVWNAVVLVAVLASPLLPMVFHAFESSLGASSWAMAAAILTILLVLQLPSLPLDWHAQFKVEAQFGFNQSTPALWWMDRAKGLVLSALLGYPILVLILKTIDWAGPHWWIWGWAALIGCQILMIMVAPAVIFPWFNRFSPLPEGSLRRRLQNLCDRLRFRARAIQVMDGSKRSSHSNAFFVGFGRFRKVVLFDTLVDQLEETELEAVVAHEIGHWKKRHILQMMAVSAGSLLLGFWAVAFVGRQPAFFEAFGFSEIQLAPALLICGLLAGCVTFWLSPLTNLWSRRNEHQADAFATRAVGDPEPLIGALRKLNEKNLSNPFPHPLYSRFYYSHPVLSERVGALKALAGDPGGRETAQLNG